jgi:hypothetical protein
LEQVRRQNPECQLQSRQFWKLKENIVFDYPKLYAPVTSNLNYQSFNSKNMADLRKILNKIKDAGKSSIEELSAEELEELEGGINVGCQPHNSSCTSNDACPKL